MKTHYERLSALDASCPRDRVTRTPTCTSARCCCSSPGPSPPAEGGLERGAHPRLLESRLQHIPLIRQRRSTSLLAAPGLDRRRPLQPLLPRPPYEPAATGKRATAEAPVRSHLLAEARCDEAAVGDWVVEGLHDGRFAVIAKAHHCMVDGVSGVDLLASCSPRTQTKTSSRRRPGLHAPRQARASWSRTSSGAARPFRSIWPASRRAVVAGPRRALGSAFRKRGRPGRGARRDSRSSRRDARSTPTTSDHTAASIGCAWTSIG
jgi:hypothetical protein